MTWLVFWIGFSLLAGYLARDKSLGFGWGFMIALVLSPLIGIIAALASSEKSIKCIHCNTSKKISVIYCPRCGLDKSGRTKEEVTLMYQTRKAYDYTKKSD